jgi:methionyl-tRNA synthetase
MDANMLVGQYWWLFILSLAWSLSWKGWALWIAAKLDQKVWFVVLLVVNTLGILDIFYIFYFSKHSVGTKTSRK